MRFALKTLALSGLVALGLAGTAQATEISISVRGVDSAWTRVADHRGFEGGGRHVEERRHGGYDDDGLRHWPERRWNRVVETRPGWDRGHGGWDRGHGGWGRGHADCRIVIRRRVNPWGDVIVKRTKICD